MKYQSTRGGETRLSFQDVLMAGLATDGGLYVPEQWPHTDSSSLERLRGKPYSHVAAYILKPFCTGDISEEEVARLAHRVYGEAVFEHKAVAPLVQIAENLWIMELFHGPTLAFKDYALQLLGQLFDFSLAKSGKRITIVGATSGDTGSAAIEACRGRDNIDIFILHPQGRTSAVQRRQMTTVDAPNVHNIAIDGTFDDCQAIVKELFADRKFRAEAHLSAINSINWARISAQITYYVYAALALGAPGRKLSFAVPTGNFGNVYAAWCARQMGLPIERLVIGTNRNDILTRFFETGTMKRSDVQPSLSPSMDIQVSSNFERYLFNLFKGDTERVSSFITDFREKGEASVSHEDLQSARDSFTAVRSTEEDTLREIEVTYAEANYVLDPHTAVGVHAAKQVLRQQSYDAAVPMVALACAHPAKFPDAVQKATGVSPEIPERLARVFDLPEFVTPLENDTKKVKEFIRSHIQT